MSDKLLQAYGKSCLTRLLFGVLLSVAAFLFIFCLGAAITLIPNRLLDEDTKALLQIATIPCFAFLLIGGVVVWVLFNNSRIYTQFDEAFTPLGLTRSRYLLSGFQYQGNYRGRQVNVYYHVSGGRYLRTPDLQIYLGGNFRTRLGLGTENILTRVGGALTRQQAITLSEPSYEGLLCYTIDETWSRNLLGQPQGQALVVRLAGKDTPGVRGLVFGPESLRLHLRHFPLSIVTPETVRQWVEDLVALAALAEELPPPTQTAEASDWERAGRLDRSRFLLPAIAIVLVLVLGIIAVMSCVVFALFQSGAFR
ncbi:MAG: hypothetical protein ACT4QE_03960 [Anaerolineales bacterium]